MNLCAWLREEKLSKLQLKKTYWLHWDAESQPCVNWLTLPNYFLHSFLLSSLGGGKEWRKSGWRQEGVQTGGRNLNTCTQLTWQWPFVMLNDSLSPHHTSHSHSITLYVCSSTYRPSEFSCGPLQPWTATPPQDSSGPSPLQVVCNALMLSRPPVFPGGCTCPMAPIILLQSALQRMLSTPGGWDMEDFTSKRSFLPLWKNTP